MLEIQCISPFPLRTTTRRCAPRRRRQISRNILGRAAIGKPAKLFEAKTHRQLSYELEVPRRLQRRCGKKEASWLWDTYCRNGTEQLDGGPVCRVPCLDFVATIASLSVPPIARLDNANWRPKGCSWGARRAAIARQARIDPRDSGCGNSSIVPREKKSSCTSSGNGLS